MPTQSPTTTVDRDAAETPGGIAAQPTPLAPQRLTAGGRWLAVWMLLLAGLALGGKGTAYIGYAPAFISEIVLLAGCFVLLFQRGWRDLLMMPTVVLILAFIAWGLVRTLPYLGTYEFDALRDGVIYGYALVGLVVAGILISQPALLPWVLQKYRGFARVFLLLMPVFWIAGQALDDKVPEWPMAPGIPVIDLSPGDAPVHLGGIVAFAIVGLFRPAFFGLPRWFLGVLWPFMTLVLVAIAGAVSRGGLVSFGLACTAAFTMRPKSSWARNLLLTVLIVLPLVALIDPRIPVPGRTREFSVRQLVLNITSIVGNDDMEGDLDETKTWRLQWWGKIIDYTFNGEYFWQGKGFGVNLADSDGFQVEFDDTPLRSPHNGHLTVLARMGVPGFALWIALQLSWLYAMVNAYVRARQRGDVTWMMLFVFLVAYWLAMQFNASFDVYFEGPMGGIWVWSIIGFGLAAAWIYERQPELLWGDDFEVQP
ncbi:O-antigen ligase family protein [Phycisphaeraceae bacterium D3-23]